MKRLQGMFELAQELGREIALGPKCQPHTKKVMGFLQPKSAADTARRQKNFVPGLADRREFLIILPPDAFAGLEKDDTFAYCEGEEYELIRVEPMYTGGIISHFECVARKTAV